jgi:D-3-phosphoglycerate dehydrogenase / 2-oxoglutarate reductase
MMKIVIAHGIGIVDKPLAMMREVAQVTVPCDDSEAALLAEVRDAHTLLVSFRPPVNRRLIESAGSLRHIARLGVGLDSIDLQAAAEHGVIVTNVPDMTSDSVAEFTMALLLSLAKNIPRCDRAVKKGRWEDRVELIRTNIELRGKTHGIVGLGRIGSRVAARCKAFGMRVLYYKRNRDLNLERSEGIEYSPFEALLRESDTISLHIPLTNETMNLIDKPQFESMKRTALLINQARGKVVNEEALVLALREGRIGGYATDVYDTEPPDAKSELFSFNNVVVSPHLGGGTREARLRATLALAEDVVRIIRGDMPKNIVNREVLWKGKK